MFLSFLILPTFVPFAKITAPVPNAGMTTLITAPDPVKPDPRIPSIDSISIDAVVYPLPGDVMSTDWIWPGIVAPSSSVPSATVIWTNPPSPSPEIGTELYTPTAYSVPGSSISILSIFLEDWIPVITGNFE